MNHEIKHTQSMSILSGPLAESKKEVLSLTQSSLYNFTQELPAVTERE